MEFKCDRILDKSLVEDINRAISTRLFYHFEPHKKSVRVEEVKTLSLFEDKEVKNDATA